MLLRIKLYHQNIFSTFSLSFKKNYQDPMNKNKEDDPIFLLVKSFLHSIPFQINPFKKKSISIIFVNNIKTVLKIPQNYFQNFQWPIYFDSNEIYK